MKKIYLFSLLLLVLHSFKSNAQLTGRWYSYSDYVDNNAGGYTNITPLNMWNDSAAKFGYMSGSTPTYNRTNLISVGSTFAPRLNAWNNVGTYGSTFKVGPTDVFTIDSVRVHGVYLRNNLKPAIKDTLRFSLTYGNGAIPTNMPGMYFGSPVITGLYGDTVRFLTLWHDSVKNVAGRYDATTPAPYIQTIILSNTDTATNFYRSYALSTPLTVPAGQVGGASLTFRSGDAAYTPGDTIVYSSGVHKYGQFQPYSLYASDGAGNPVYAIYSRLDSNVGLFKQVPAPGWNAYYIPTWAWNAGSSIASSYQYPVIDFHITCPTCRLNDTITGIAAVCVSSTTTLAHSVAGGTWSSSSGSTATVSAAGVITGMAVGTANITYSVSGHITVRTVTVNASATAGTLSGTATVCQGATTTLTPSVTGGTWLSSTTSVATVTSGGVVNGVSGGTATISYTITNGCGSATATRVVTVNPLPAAGTLSGSSTVCVGATTTLSPSVTGGTWSSSGAGIATVSSGGVVSGVSGSTVAISYTVSNSCGSASATKVMTVNVLPVAGTLSGGAAFCQGATITLTPSMTGGTWSSSATGVGAVSAGVVTGVSGGTAIISYSVTNSCGAAYATYIATVNPLPVAGTLSGGAALCAGATITLTPSVSGGSWSSGSGAASVSGTGVVTGVSTGTAVITYTKTNSCGSSYATYTATVDALPVAGTLSGGSSVCVGASTTLTPSMTGGTWSSSTTGTATVSGGIVTGVAGGTATISYTVTNGCGSAYATYVATINPLPDAGTISGSATICIGTATTMTETATGGTWSMTSGKAVISSSGVATGLTPGADVVVYTCINSCGTTTAILPVTVVAHPDPITLSGVDFVTVCVGNNIVLTPSAPGGSWSASNGNATVSGGTVTGVVAGTVTITYTITNDCGTETGQKIVTVNDCPTGVGSLSNGGNISIFPNPVTSTLSITSSSNIDNVVVTNVVGQKVYSKKFNGDKVTVDMSQMPAGVYTIRVNGSSMYKVVKE